MSFAAPRMLATGGFPSLALATAFAIAASNGSQQFSGAGWTLNANGTISETLQYGTVSTNTYSATYGTPVLANGGADYEAQLVITSGSMTQTAPVTGTLNALGTTVNGPQASLSLTTPWVSLDTAPSISTSLGGVSLGGAGSITFSGTLFIRHKITRQQVQQSVSINVSY